MSRLSDAINEVLGGLEADAKRLRGIHSETTAEVARHLDGYVKLIEENWAD